jgi:hypothetical protein
MIGRISINYALGNVINASWFVLANMDTKKTFNLKKRIQE